MPGPEAETIVFGFTTPQGRRFVRGLAGVGIALWMIGAVRLGLSGRLGSARGLLSLLVLALALSAAILVVGRIRPIVVLAHDRIEIAWGPRHRRIPREAVTEIDVRERGQARRVLLRLGQGAGNVVLPVPLSGGSILGPGPDPGLDAKVDLLRRWCIDAPAS